MPGTHPDEPVFFRSVHSRCLGVRKMQRRWQGGRPFGGNHVRGRAREWVCRHVGGSGPVGMMRFHRTDGWFLMLPAGNSGCLPSVTGCIPASCPEGRMRPAARLRGCAVAFVVAHARFHLSVRLFRDMRIGEPVSLLSHRGRLAGGADAADTNDLSFPVRGAH